MSFKLSVIIGLVIMYSPAYSQNLVPNSSFEELDTCFVGKDMVVHATGWWDWVGTPDYFHSCSPDPQVTVPNNLFSYQEPSTGEAYCGYLTYYSENLHEFIATKLIEPLEVGEEYYLSFKVNAVQSENYFISSYANNAGLRFYASIVDTSLFEIGSLPNEAHLNCDFVISDTTSWLTVSGTFIPEEPYEYLALGNFFSNGLTDTVHVGEMGSNSAYVFVDDVCVSRNGNCDEVVNSTQEIDTNGLIVYPIPCSGECEIIVPRIMGRCNGYLYNSVGVLVKNFEMEGGMAKSIEVYDLKSGFYLLRIQSEKKENLVKLIVTSSNP